MFERLRLPTFTPSESTPSDGDRPKSTLECVVDMLKGSIVFVRITYFDIRVGSVWLTQDMNTLMWRVSPKKRFKAEREFQVFSLLLSKVKRLKVTQREISLFSVDEPRVLRILLPSRDKTTNWGRGLLCLLPEVVTGQLRLRRIKPQSQPYDPIMDEFEGKPIREKRRLGELVVLGSIGRGAFGSVKLGLSVESRRFYAIKIISKNIVRRYNRNIRLEGPSSDSDRTDRISELPEISVMRKLEHSNVIKLKEVIDDDKHDCLCIITEYLPNGSVMSSAQLSGAKPMKETRAREAFVDVLAGLHYLRSKCVVHRDIKPDNLLTAGDGSVKISDFGSAKVYNGPSDNDDDSCFPTVGTPAFTAPEMCVSEKAPPKPARAYAADLWSLGASLFYMVYGRAPFQAKSVFEMYDAICKKKLNFPKRTELRPGYDQVSQECVDVIEMLLHKDPQKRPSFEQILKMPWLANAWDIKRKVDALKAQVRRST